MHKVKKYIAEDLKFSNQTIKEMKINSKKFYNKIKERRSIREFSKDKIDINIIKNAILSAGSAPSGANLQPWHFVVIKNKNVKFYNNLSDLYKSEYFSNIEYVINFSSSYNYSRNYRTLITSSIVYVLKVLLRINKKKLKLF